jgi:hypothetical protein
MKTQEYKELKIMTSEVKKGDKFSISNSNEVAESDAFQYRGAWSVEYFKCYSYKAIKGVRAKYKVFSVHVWETTEVTVLRPVKSLDFKMPKNN